MFYGSYIRVCIILIWKQC